MYARAVLVAAVIVSVFCSAFTAAQVPPRVSVNVYPPPDTRPGPHYPAVPFLLPREPLSMYEPARYFRHSDRFRWKII